MVLGRAGLPTPHNLIVLTEDRSEADDAALDLRVSDAERQAVVDLLRHQTSAGRLTLSEFEERLDEVYRARTGRELRLPLRELPVEPPQFPLAVARPGRSPEDISDDELRRRYRLRMRNDLAGFMIPNFVCNAIWLMGDGGYWWPGWVLMGTGAGVIGSLFRGFDPEKERAALAAERRTQAMAEIEARHSGQDSTSRDD